MELGFLLLSSPDFLLNFMVLTSFRGNIFIYRDHLGRVVEHCKWAPAGGVCSHIAVVILLLPFPK